MAIQASQAFINYEEEIAQAIIRSRRYPPLNPLDPRAIKVIGQSFSQDPRTPLEYLTQYTTRITRYIP